MLWWEQRVDTVAWTGAAARGSMLTSSYNTAVDSVKGAAQLLGLKRRRKELAALPDAPLQDALDHSRAKLEQASRLPATEKWLKPHLATPEGTEEIYTALERHIEQPDFLSKLERAKQRSSLSEAAGNGAAEPVGEEVLHEGWWDAPAGAASGMSDASAEGYTEVVAAADGPEAEQLGSYVMVQRADVLDAIGTFVAAYLAELPEAQNLQPAQLQAALKTAFKELRKGRVRRLWEWGRALYRITAFSYGAFSVYENPWLVRALLAALWTACRVMIGAGFGIITL